VEGRDLLEVLTSGERIDGRQLGADLAAFLRALQVIDTIDAPLPGKRGRALIDRDEVVRSGVAELNGEFDCDRLLDVWDEALAAEPWPGPPVWVHGDLLPGNLVVADGRLAGVIDWSATGAGDSACDLMVAWSLPADARAHFRDDLKVDDATWARAQGWVIEQAVPFIPYYEHTLPAAVAVTSQRLAAMLAEA
jgi:aminoglycoside phosphotransferase (APT) family kinase protein